MKCLVESQSKRALIRNRCTSGLLFFLASICESHIICDPGGLVFEYYNLRKLMVDNIDYGIDPLRIRINTEDYEEWDYYHPEYDREVEITKKLFKEKIETELPKTFFEPKEIKIPVTEEEFFEIVDEIISNFKNMIENSGYELLWDESGKQRKEEICQVLFDVCLKSYCKSRGIDLTREPETGRGPIDFRFSSTVDYIAHVELKKDSNPKLAHRLSKQLPTYMSSEDVRLGFFIIFDFGNKDISKLKEKLEKQRTELEKNQNLKLRIIYIDVKPKPSASHV